MVAENIFFVQLRQQLHAGIGQQPLGVISVAGDENLWVYMIYKPFDLGRIPVAKVIFTEEGNVGKTRALYDPAHIGIGRVKSADGDAVGVEIHAFFRGEAP